MFMNSYNLYDGYNFIVLWTQIKLLKEAKQQSLSTCDSTTKKNYLQKDISILNELLKMISEPIKAHRLVL